MLAEGGTVASPGPVIAAYLDHRRFGTLPAPAHELDADVLDDLREVATLVEIGERARGGAALELASLLKGIR